MQQLEQLDTWLRSNRYVTFLLSVVAVNVAGGLPALLGGPDSAWFNALTKPALFPPPQVFGIVWPLLFTLMGLALGLLILADHDDRRRALLLFLVQMVFNMLWTPVFFAFHSIEAALLVIIPLLAAVLATIKAVARIDRRAALLLVPYLLWIAFALVLNYRFLVLN